MRRNDSELTPKGYKSYELGQIEHNGVRMHVNLLVRKSLVERVKDRPGLVIIAILIALGFITGEIQCNVIKEGDPEWPAPKETPILQQKTKVTEFIKPQTYNQCTHTS